jgi:hypothetical protein
MPIPYDKASEIAASSLFIKKNITAKKTFNASYIFYRIARPFLKFNYKVFKWLNPKRPWTSQASIRIFEKILTKEMVGFEYGSGNSTIFFAKKLKQLTSVEHNAEWFKIVSAKLKEQGFTNVNYHHIPAENIERVENYTFYQDFKLDENDFQIMKKYHNYFSFIKNFPDQYFDFIIVDGRARVECCLNAITKLKSGGIFVLDNSDRERYQPVFKVLSHWKCITTTTGLFDTTFWFKA